MIDAALTLTGVSKAFDKPVITDLDLTIAPGQLYALLGPNGAGKTTTLRMVVGLTPPDRGRISIYGIDVARDPNAAKAITAWLPDEPMIYDKLSPSEYLAFVAGLWRIPPDEAAADRPPADGPALVVPLQLRLADGTLLSLVSTTTVFGTALDVTVQELALETFFPADAATAEALRALAADLPAAPGR